MKKPAPAQDIVARFLPGNGARVLGRLGRGHINDTFEVVCETGEAPARYVLQRINERVFRRPRQVMENVARVTAHLGEKLSNTPGAVRRALALVPTAEGGTWYEDPEGGIWRMYRFIERAHTVDTAATSAQAFEAGHAIGRFQALLADLPPPPLHPTIPGFHDTPARFAAFRQALEADALNRATAARDEIRAAMDGEPVTRLLGANLPERITHNDTKLNNVMLDDATGESLCMVDLDTVMPGLTAHDFGDLVRSCVNPAAEDEPDPARVGIAWPVFEAVTRGYLAGAGVFLSRSERDHLAVAGQVMAYELGLRFLTDYLEGDTYFRARRQGQNLNRARVQFTLFRAMVEAEARMQRCVAEV